MIEMNWFLPTGGDSRDVLPDDSSINRAPSHAYLAQVARACEELGFDALLTPCGTGCEDAWLATASLIALTSRIKFLVAFRPALLTPTLAAQMASTFQRMSNGRCLVNIVTGAEQAELARFGVTEDKETRYERTGEFIEVMRGAWSGEPFSYKGKYFEVTDATTREVPNPIPPIYFGDCPCLFACRASNGVKADSKSHGATLRCCNGRHAFLALFDGVWCFAP